MRGECMKAFRILLFSLVLSSTAFGARIGLSPIRQANEDHAQAAFRTNLFTPVASSVPQRMSKSLKDLDIRQIPDVGSYSDLENHFKYIRDLRFIEDSRHANTLRRLTWLYPDDGCYARADMASRALEDIRFVTPKKVFVFGNLRARTNNTSHGYVTWWYHVAVTYRVGSTAYVYDPAIEPKAPITLDAWNTAVGGNSTRVTYAICDHNTFDPNMDCVHPNGLSLDEVLREQSSFLPDEWERLLDLNRDPVKELGDFPPWLQN